MSFSNNPDSKNQGRSCNICGKRLPERYPYSFCLICRDNDLLRKAKEYIRANDVNEFEVAEHFHIPVKTVKRWLKEGNIEYRSKNERTFTLHCERCHAPITFGTVCSKCLRLMNNSGKGFGRAPQNDGDDQMWFLNRSR